MWWQQQLLVHYLYPNMHDRWNMISISDPLKTTDIRKYLPAERYPHTSGSDYLHTHNWN